MVQAESQPQMRQMDSPINHEFLQPSHFTHPAFFGRQAADAQQFPWHETQMMRQMPEAGPQQGFFGQAQQQAPNFPQQQQMSLQPMMPQQAPMLGSTFSG